MRASHKTHRPHIKVGKDAEEVDIKGYIIVKLFEVTFMLMYIIITIGFVLFILVSVQMLSQLVVLRLSIRIVITIVNFQPYLKMKTTSIPHKWENMMVKIISK